MKMNTSFNMDDNNGFDTASIDDVLLCWESDDQVDDDADSIQMMHKVREEFLEDAYDTDQLPVSPRAAPLGVYGQCNDLQTLMKKYPDFIPKGSPKVPVKRRRPLCTFVNFMGTRCQPKALTKAAAKPLMVKSEDIDPSPCPTDAPTDPARLNQKANSKEYPMVTPTGAPKKRQKVYHLSPMPTLAPTSSRKVVSPTP